MVQPLPDLGEVKVVLEDLDFLTKTWDHNVDESSLRITSPILYRLIVEGHLGRVASSLGIELRIMAMAEAQEMSRKNTKAIRFWLAGGGLSGNVKVWDVQVFDRSLSAEEIADINRRSLPHRGKKKPEKLGRYGKLPAFVLDGAIINNEEVIKYVTDKLGGRHYSAERGAAPLQAKYKLLDGIHQTIGFAGKDAVYLALVSIGQAITNSRDVHRVRDACRRLLAFGGGLT